jgi:hypothetical protein
MSRKTVGPGQKVTSSGIYRDSSSGEKSTLVGGRKAPPTVYRGGKWVEVVETNPK